MNNLNTDLKKLVISRALSERLVKLGLHKAAVFHWFQTVDDSEEKKIVWELGQLENPDQEDLPAWTYEELRLMIGNAYDGADLPEPRPNIVDPNEGEKFNVLLPSKMLSFEKGAEANGTFLEHLINGHAVKVEAVNARYFKKFKPE